MAKMTVSVVHPSSGNSVEVELDSDVILHNVIFQLREEGFLKAGNYGAALKTSNGNVALDNEKSLSANGVTNYSKILITNATQAG
ncbi:MAG: hypothetical protein IJ736_10985 [Firmicutes bacterium]|nr:hypothetical protein [Bacillota bacterium]